MYLKSITKCYQDNYKFHSEYMIPYSFLTFPFNTYLSITMLYRLYVFPEVVYSIFRANKSM